MSRSETRVRRWIARGEIEQLRAALAARDVRRASGGTEVDIAADLRLTVVEALPELDARTAVVLLAEASGDPVAAVRIAAVETLGTFDAPEAGNALLAVVLRERELPEIIDRARDLLVGSRIPGAETFARMVAREEARELSEESDRALLRDVAVDDDGALAEALCEHLGDPDPAAGRAALALAALGEVAVPALVAASEDPPRARAATRLLGRCTDVAAEEALIELLQSDAAPDLRAEAARGLGAQGDPAITDVLVQAAADPEREVRIAAAAGLAAIGPAAAVRAIEPLVRQLSDADATT